MGPPACLASDGPSGLSKCESSRLEFGSDTWTSHGLIVTLAEIGPIRRRGRGDNLSNPKGGCPVT